MHTLELAVVLSILTMWLVRVVKGAFSLVPVLPLAYTTVAILKMREYDVTVSVRRLTSNEGIQRSNSCCPCHAAPCNNSEIRLSGSSYDFEGRVEVCVNETWGTVCDDAWDSNDAMVVCRQLMYSTNGMLVRKNSACSGDINMRKMVLQVWWRFPLLLLALAVDQSTLIRLAVQEMN